MDDYLTEQDQWEMIKRWLKDNGPWIVGGVVVGGALLFGWRWYQDRITADSEGAGVQYTQLTAAVAQGDIKRATELSQQLRKEHSRTPYVDQADLALAKLHVERNELEEGAQKLRTVMKHTSDEELRRVVTLRLARVLLAQKKPDDALKLLGDDTSKAGAFSSSYTEVRGDALLAKGDRAGALKAYRDALLAAEQGTVDQSSLEMKINDLAGVSAGG